MRGRDFLHLIFQSVAAHRMRSTLTALGIGIGVTAVVLLTSIGEGLNRYIMEEFTQFGTTTIAVQPGKANTLGISPGALNSVRPLSLADAEALTRAPYVLHSVPVVTGSGSLEGNGRERNVAVYAVGPDFDRTFRFEVAAGTFLPPDELDRARNVAVQDQRRALGQVVEHRGEPVEEQRQVDAIAGRLHAVGERQTLGVIGGDDHLLLAVQRLADGLGVQVGIAVHVGRFAIALPRRADAELGVLHAHPRLETRAGVGRRMPATTRCAPKARFGVARWRPTKRCPGTDCQRTIALVLGDPPSRS